MTVLGGEGGGFEEGGRGSVKSIKGEGDEGEGGGI